MTPIWYLLVVLLVALLAHGTMGAENEGKARAYHPGTPEFDKLVKSIRGGEFTRKPKQPKPTRSDL